MHMEIQRDDNLVMNDLFAVLFRNLRKGAVDGVVPQGQFVVQRNRLERLTGTEQLGKEQLVLIIRVAIKRNEHIVFIQSGVGDIAVKVDSVLAVGVVFVFQTNGISYL